MFQQETNALTVRSLRLVWAIASLVRPRLILEIGKLDSAASTKVLVSAVRQWSGRVVKINGAGASLVNVKLPGRYFRQADHAPRASSRSRVEFIHFQSDRPSYERVRQQLHTWAETRLFEGGVAVFREIPGSGGARQLSSAVRDWLCEQPPVWQWQDFGNEAGLGLLWHLADQPAFEEVLGGSWSRLPQREDGSSPRASFGQTLLLEHQHHPRNRFALNDAHASESIILPNGIAISLYLRLTRVRPGKVQVEQATFECEPDDDDIVPQLSMMTQLVSGQVLEYARQLDANHLIAAFGAGANPSLVSAKLATNLLQAALSRI